MTDLSNIQELKVVSDKDVISKLQPGLIRLDVGHTPEFDREDIERHIGIYKMMGFGSGNKGNLLIIADGNVIMTKEARDLSSVHTKNYFNKVAVVGGSLTVRFLVNFLNRFYKFDVEMRLFSKEDEAVKWLAN